LGIRLNFKGLLLGPGKNWDQKFNGPFWSELGLLVFLPLRKLD